MNELNDFLNLISDAKKESENKIGNYTIDNLSDKIKENPFSSLLETTKIIHEEPEITQIKKPDTSFLFGKIKDNSFLSLLESEIVKSKEVEQVEQIQEQEFASLFDTAKVTLKDEIIAEPIVTEIVEEVIPEVLVEAPKSLTDASHYDKLFKTNVDLFNQPKLPKVNPEMKAVTDKLQYMENWLSKISMAGPGGGEVNLRWLDDIDRSSIANGRYLKYNQFTNKFQFDNPNANEVGVLDYLQLNTNGPGIDPFPGTLSWNPTEDCLNVTQNDGSTLQVGLENYIQVHNHTGSTLLNGSVVKFSGVDSTIADLPLCELMVSDSNSEPLYIIGVLTNDIGINQSGRATILGRVHDVNTTGSDVNETWNVGDILWVHPTLPGKMTKVKPTLPNIATSVAAIVSLGTTDGTLLVRPTIWPRLNYGVFSNTVDHTITDINTAYPIELDLTNIASGFSLSSNSHIIASQSGLYNFNMSAQLSSTNSSTKNVYFWVNKNNTDVNYSTRSQTINGNNTRMTFSCNWTVSLNANDYVKLMWAADDITIRLDSAANTSFCPSTPSILITVTQAAL